MTKVGIMRLPKTAIIVLSAVLLTAALATGVSAAVLESGSAKTTTYYGCLNAGTLSQVGTKAPTCTLPAVQISWLSSGSTDTKAQVNSAISAANGGLCRVPPSGTAAADLHGCNLSDQLLSNLSLPGVNFKGANLAGAALTDDTLTAANLWGTNAVGAGLVGANLTGANLTGADLAAVDFNGAVFGSTSASTTYLNGANMTADVLTNATFTNASLLNADLSGVIGLANATFTNTICPDGLNSDAMGHTCLGHESAIPAARNYQWVETNVAPGPSSGAWGMVPGTTTFPAGSTVSAVSGSLTADNSYCAVPFEATLNVGGATIASWGSNSGPAQSLSSVVLSNPAALNVQILCGDDNGFPSPISFNVTVTVTPAVPYS